MTTFDAVPPGQQETRIKPTANSGGKFINVAIPQPKNGMIRNCNPTPIRTGRGDLATVLKSSKFNVIPIPSIMTARPRTIRSPLNQVNTSGQNRAVTAPATVQTGNRFVAVLKSRSMN